MKFQVIPLIYSANGQFKNTIRFAVEFHENILPEALVYAVGQVQKRYPYYSVKIEKEAEGFVLAENNQPFIIAAGEKPVCLNSKASNMHLLAFAWKERTVWIDISHFICDGNGLAPLVKTLVYYYVEKRYGVAGIDTSNIRMVTDNIPEEEYAYPFPATPLPNENSLSIAQRTYDPFLFPDELFDGDGSYAYNLQVSQKALIHYTTNMKTVRPWYSNTNHPFAEEFRKYLDDSPWKDKQMGEMVFHAKEAKIISLVEKLPRNLSLQVLGWLGEKTFGVRRIL